jgi:hypothetical protein
MSRLMVSIKVGRKETSSRQNVSCQGGTKGLQNLFDLIALTHKRASLLTSN